MTLKIRTATLADVPAMAQICYDAFADISGQHGFPADFPHVDAAIAYLSDCVSHEELYSIVAEQDGRVVGSNVLDERNPIRAIGPITVDTSHQDGQVGRALMAAVLSRVSEREALGVRLVQVAYNGRSLALYTKLGFEAREPLACFQGTVPGPAVPGYAVRAATSDDRDALNALCGRVHGHARPGELDDAIAKGTAKLVMRDSRITGFATSIAYFGHGVAETNDDLQALITATPEMGGPGLLIPVRNAALMRWCLSQGLRISQTLTLMSRGLYNEPTGAWFPSISN
jgi:predicted N-acetyltransferase YhbS